LKRVRECLLYFCQWEWCSDVGNDVFVLGIGEKLFVQIRFVCGWVMGEGDFGVGVFVFVVEYYLDDADCGVEVVGDVVCLVVYLGVCVVLRVKDGVYCL